MSLLNKKISSLSFLFFLGIIATSYKSWLSLLVILIILFTFYKINAESRPVTSIFTAFLLSFLLFQLINILIDQYEITKEVRVLLNRGLLLIIFVGLCVVRLMNKKDISFFNNKPNWNTRIDAPFHSVKLSWFMLIGVMISGVSFIPLILQQELSDIKSWLLFCLLFSIINATLEEIIWRGVMLSSLLESVSVTSAVIITSIGFGLLHLAIGIPFIVSLLFSIGGVIYAFVVLKTKSIYPSIILHFVINIGMVLSGLIL